MMIQETKREVSTWTRRWWQAAFALLLSLVLVMEAVPQLSAKAISRIGDEISMLTTEPVAAERILWVGSPKNALRADQRVTIRYGENEYYATSREDESVSQLLQRQGIGVEPQEMVRAEVSEDGVQLEIASDFTYYETAEEALAYGTVTVADCTLPKGETVMKQEGREGVKGVTYEIVYADGEMISRRPVSEEEITPAVDETVVVGTLVRESQPGDTISEVIQEEDGGGYLILDSGDSLHFTDCMEVKCTAYTANVGKVGTITYTGTTVHEGVVAVDKSVIPLGSWMFIASNDGEYTYGIGHAEDTGVRGKSVDLYMDTYNECIQFGRRASMVYFLDME